MKKRKISKNHFQFEYEYYNSEGILNQRMLHLKIYTESPIQTDLWLNEKEQEMLKEILEE